MLEKLQRPLSAKERRCLSRLLEATPHPVTLSGALRWFALWARICVACAFLFAKGLFQKGGPAGVWMFVIPVVVVLGILSFYFGYMVVSGYFRWARHARRFVRNEAPKIRAALDHGGASVYRIVSNRVIVIEEFEDEGSAYIYDLGDNTSFYLRGEDYYPEEKGSPWPAGRFEIVRTELGGRLIGMFGVDEPLEPIRIIPMSEMPENFWHSDEPKTESVLAGRPEEILVRLGHRAET